MVINKTVDIEDELNAIRLKLYEEVKDMTPEEFIAYLNAETMPVMQQYGIKMSTLKPVEPRKQVEMAV